MDHDEPMDSASLDADRAQEQRLRAASAGVTRHLMRSATRTPAGELRSLLAEVDQLDDPARWDRYGDSGPVQVLEQQVAELLGKPAAAMFPSGVMAQQSVLRVWSDRQQCNRIALPALSHLLHHELDGPRLLHGLRYEHLTEGAKVPMAADLDEIPGALGAVLLELPLRDAGHLLPTWDELAVFPRACQERGVPLHLDGARIWESQPFLGHGLAEIAALADTVYVSFYKGLGGMAGAAVAGPADVIGETRQWRTRHGGTLFTLLPYALAALRGLRDELPRMGEYREYALSLAAALPAAGFTVFPGPPHTNAFRIFAPAPAREIVGRVIAMMENDDLAATPPWSPAEVPGWSWTEVTVGSSTVQWPVDEAVDVLRRVAFGTRT